jgi:SAM-dependent methyltransferase
LEENPMKWRRDREDLVELLDNPRIADAIRIRALGEVERANAYFGGNSVVLDELRLVLRGWRSGNATVLDVGTGAGGIAARIRAEGRKCGVAMTTIGIDLSAPLVRATHRAGALSVCGDALSLPFADDSVDLVVCSQLLHHFSHAEAIAVIRELARIARHRVIVCDLRRSWIAAGAFWLAAHTLGFHPVTRHDGVVSVLRSFTPAELEELVRGAVGQAPVVRQRVGFRLAASWTPEKDPRTGVRRSDTRRLPVACLGVNGDEPEALLDLRDEGGGLPDPVSVE